MAERAVADLVTAVPAGEDPSRVPWPALERRIQAWILALRRLVRLAVAEHRAAAAVWPPPHDEAAFSEVVARPLAAAAQVRSAPALHGLTLALEALPEWLADGGF